MYAQTKEKAKVEFVRDADGKLETILVNGKKKGGFARGWRKAQQMPYWIEYTDNLIAQNPFSGVKVALTPLEATIYAFCIMWYRQYERGNSQNAPIQTYDDMKYFLLEINPQAYYDLLD